MSKEYLDVIHNESDKITSCAYHLEALSRAFYETGNSVIGGQLDTIATDLHEARSEISGAVSKNINNEYQQAQQSSMNVVKACLAGIEISKTQSPR